MTDAKNVVLQNIFSRVTHLSLVVISFIRFSLYIYIYIKGLLIKIANSIKLKTQVSKNLLFKKISNILYSNNDNSGMIFPTGQQDEIINFSFFDRTRSYALYNKNKPRGFKSLFMANVTA